jgi:ribosomal protein L12E/L44/L45/RPP1/RPP2
MAYKNLGTFLTKVTLKAIAKLDDADVDECMRIAENVMAWASAGTITSEQLDELLAALPVEIDEPESEQS